MKIKKIFESQMPRSAHDHQKSLISILCIIFFWIVCLINPDYNTTEAKEPNGQLFISQWEEDSADRPVHRLFRKAPTPKQAQYFALFTYDKNKGLSNIAKQYGVEVSQILDLNAISNEYHIPDGMTLYASSIPGRIFVNNKAGRTINDVLSTLHIDNEKNIKDYNGGSEIMKSNLLYGSPIFILSGAVLDPELIQKTNSSIYDLSIAEYEDLKYKIEKPIYSETGEKKTREPSTKIVSRSNIIKTRRPSIREENGMVPGHCTFYAAHKALFLFPEIKPWVRKKIIRWDANQWLASAKRNGFKTTNIPSIWAVVVFKNGSSSFFSAGHVAIVESVNREEKSMIVSDMNYAGLGIVTERLILLNDTMTEAVSSSQNIMWFIPVQELPEGLQDNI